MSETPAPAPSATIHTSEDEKRLHQLGYAQELLRAMGAFRNFAISFTIISILAGCLTSYYIAFQWGGPVAVTWGWLLVSAFTILVALSMAEIASTYPTAGGLYYWSSKLGNAGWGWFTGWFNLIGLVGIIAAVGYGLAIFATSLLNLLWDYPNDIHHIFYVFVAVLIGATLVNVFDVRITSFINGVSAWWHVIGTVIIVLALVIVPDSHQSVSYAFTTTINNSGYSGHGWGSLVFWMVFAIGLTMSQYTITGYDASAHMAEETHKASRGAALGMIYAVVISVIAGFILLLALTMAIPDTKAVQEQFTYIVTWIWEESMSRRWAELLLFIVVFAQFYCLTACITSGSRMLFAFSRDRAVPGHQLWRKVSRHRVPVFSVVAVGCLGFLLMVPTWWNNLAGYYVGTSVGTTGLYIAFILPVILRYRKRESFEHGAWSLGSNYKWINPLAIVWVAFITIVFMLPTGPKGIPGNDAGFDWNYVNYAPLTILGAFLLFGGWWVLSAKNWFEGPVRMGTDEELEQLEARQEAGFLLPADTEYT